MPFGGTTNGILQVDGNPEFQNVARTLNRRHITQRGRIGNGPFTHEDLRIWIQGGSDNLRQFENADIAVGADVDGDKGGSPEQNRPQPESQVGGVQIGAVRSSVT